MKKLVFLGGLFLATNCGKRTPCPSYLSGHTCASFVRMAGYGHDQIDEPLKRYFDEYLDERANHGLPRRPANTAVKIHYRELSGGEFGLCYRKQVRSAEGQVIFHRPEILISPKARGDFTLRYVIFHELGHCIHDYSHDSPIKIMHATYSAGTFFSTATWDAMLDEYFAAAQ